MLFLTIPLLIALAACVGIVVIVWRKMSFLRRLTPEAHEMGDTWLHDMAPEALDWLGSIPWQQYRRTLFVEFEKMLRRGRLLMSALDRASAQLVNNVRRVHEKAAKEVKQQEIQAAQEAKEEEKEFDDLDMDDPEQLHMEEQRLIVAIAQQPKEPKLYSDLARVYVKLRNYTDAAESLKAAIKLDPEDVNLSKRLESVQRRLAAQ